MTEQGQFGLTPESQSTPQDEEHEGERYLRLLGLGNLAYEPLQLEDGRTIMCRDFLESEKCATYARPMLIGFEAMSPDHPLYEATRISLVKHIGLKINPELSSSQENEQ